MYVIYRLGFWFQVWTGENEFNTEGVGKYRDS